MQMCFEHPLYGNKMNYSLLTDEEAFRLPGVELRRRPHLYPQTLSVSIVHVFLCVSFNPPPVNKAALYKKNVQMKSFY